jgi:hypothetical protein
LFVENSTNSFEEETYFDAAFKKDSEKNIMGILIAGESPMIKKDMKNDQILKEVLFKLDEIFDNKANKNYKKHLIQN